MQMLGQNRVFDWAEERRMQTQQKQAAHQQIQAVPPESDARHEHDADFQQLHPACQHRLVVLVGQLPGRRRKQEKRQDENAGGQVREKFGRQGRPLGRLKRQQDNQGILEQVVVEGPEELGGEKRAKATSVEQGKLRTHDWPA